MIYCTQRTLIWYWLHCAPIFATCFLSIDLKVLLNLSTAPLHCGWSSVVFNFFIPSSLQISFIKNDSKFIPWYDSIASCTPNIGTISSTSNWAICSAFCSGVGKTICHLVSRSWNMITYQFPWVVMGSFMISTQAIWKGCSVTIGWSSDFCLLRVPSTIVHCAQLLA